MRHAKAHALLTELDGRKGALTRGLARLACLLALAICMIGTFKNWRK